MIFAVPISLNADDVNVVIALQEIPSVTFSFEVSDTYLSGHRQTDRQTDR